MARITEKDLRNLVNILNEETGNPVEYFNAETKRCNPGNFHLDIAYGGFALCRTCNDAGGASNIIGRGTKQELYDRIQAFRAGIRFGRENVKANPRLAEQALIMREALQKARSGLAAAACYFDNQDSPSVVHQVEQALEEVSAAIKATKEGS